MATVRFYNCKICGRSPIRMSLFDTLHQHARQGPPVCSRCAKPSTLQLKFAFGLDAADSDTTVRDCFVPQKLETWKNTDGHSVTFYPLLVVVHRHARRLAFGLSYWHVIDDGVKRTRKYGQWAPFMDEHLFRDLITQAQEKGHLMRVRPAI